MQRERECRLHRRSRVRCGRSRVLSGSGPVKSFGSAAGAREWEAG